MAGRRLIPRKVLTLKHTATTSEGADPLKNYGRWWENDSPDARADAARNVATMLFSMHTPRNMRDALAIGLYENEPPYWLGAAMPNSPLLVQTSSAMDAFTKARANLLRRCIDTAASMLCKQPSEIRCLTSAGTWGMQKKAKQRQKFVNGLLRETGFHELRKRSFIDGCLTRAGGTPLFEIDEQNGKIVCRRIHASQIAWNDYDGDAPQELYLRYPVKTSVLIDKYPQFADKIRECTHTAQPVNRAYRRIYGNEALADLIEVTECWHLSADDKKPGFHSKSIANCNLTPDDKWTLPVFPVPRFCWSRADYGWDNRPVFDDLVGYHVEIGKMMRKINRGQNLACVPRVWIEQGSEVIEDEVTNEIGGVGTYRGTPPQFTTSGAFPPEFYQYLDWLFRQAMSDIGINEMQSAAQIPRGFEQASGKALRELNDTGSSRQILHGEALEQQTIEAADIIFQLAAQLAKKNKDFAVNALGTRSYEKIDWASVAGDLKDTRFICTPASALPSGTTAKIQTVAEIIKGGLLPPEEVKSGLGLKLLNFPDFEKVVTLETATWEAVEMMVDSALYDGIYIAPEPYLGPTGLARLKTMTYRQYMQALEMDGVPERNMDLLRRLMSEADTLTQQGKAPDIQEPMDAVPAPAPAPAEQSPIAPPPMPVAAGGPQ